jgi:putative membrane protein
MQIPGISFDALLPLCLSTGPRVAPATFWQAWSLAPEIVLPLLLLLAAYFRAVAPSARFGHRAAFVAGWVLLAAALTSPLCRASASLASAHMLQYLLLLAIAPPLLVLGVPEHRRAAWRHPESWARHPLAVGTLYAAAVWLAHAPAVYEAALRGAAAHLALLAAVLAASLVFWSAVLAPRALQRDPVSTLALCFSAMVQTSLLGALLTFSDGLWYPLFGARTASWGLTPLDDQRLAGLIMWVPMNMVYVIAALGQTLRWLRTLAARHAIEGARLVR